MIPLKMKLTLIITATLGLVATLNAAETMGLGPKGGRLLETAPQKTEFYVNQDRHVEVSFYDSNLKPLTPGKEVVAVIAEHPNGRTPIAMEKTAAGFVSKVKLPEGEPYRVVVQVRGAADTRPQNFRIEFNLEKCGGCHHPEYACTCGH